jgi:NAD(P)H-dependent FMN reductase
MRGAGRAVGPGVPTVLTITGSLNTGSANTQVLDLAAAVAPEDVVVARSTSVEDLPHFRPDVEAPADGPVAAFRREIGEADAVLIATPEYAHALPGALKDALDWVVGSGELYGKPVAILSAAPAPERGGNAREMLERTLRAQGADVVSSSTVVVPKGAADLDDEVGAELVVVLAGLLSRARAELGGVPRRASP